MDNTKEIILKTAYGMFLGHNYEAVTINGIIKAAGLTKGAFYYYYSSKEELFKAVVDKYMIENQIDLPDTDFSLQDLINYAISKAKKQWEKFLSLDSAKRYIMPRQYISLVMAAYQYYPDYAEIGNKFFRNQLNRWKEVLVASIKNGEIREDIDVDITAVNFMAISVSIMMNCMVNSEVDSIVMFEKQLNGLYALLRR